MVWRLIFQRFLHPCSVDIQHSLKGTLIFLSFSRYLELARLSSQVGSENTVERGASMQLSSDLFDGEDSDTVDYSHLNL